MARSTIAVTLDPAVYRFAQRLVEEVDATKVLLVGSRARGINDVDSDYDFIIVSDRFTDVDPFEREFGIKAMFYEIVGLAPIDLYCLTPDEFEIGKNRTSMLAAVLPEAIDLLGH